MGPPLVQRVTRYVHEFRNGRTYFGWWEFNKGVRAIFAVGGIYVSYYFVFWLVPIPRELGPIPASKRNISTATWRPATVLGREEAMAAADDARDYPSETDSRKKNE